jgi:transposase
MSYVALDVHQKSSTMVFLDPATGETGLQTFPSCRSELHRALAQVEPPWVVALEATRITPPFVEWLRAEQAEIHLANPRRLKAMSQGQPIKSDARDARWMLQLLLAGLLPECYLAPPAVTDRRVLIRGYRALRRTSTSLRNQVRVGLVQAGLILAATDLRGQRAQAQVEACLEQLPPTRRLVTGRHWRLLGETESELAQVHAEIVRQVGEHRVPTALTKLPGLGETMGFALWAEIGEVSRFAQVKYLLSYAGLAPVVSDSDEHQGRRHLPHECNKHLRHWCVQGAQVAARCNLPSKARSTWRRLANSGRRASAPIAAARELLTDVYYTWQRIGD